MLSQLECDADDLLRCQFELKTCITHNECVGIVFVQMAGACGTCPSATATLKMGIERLLMEEIPEVRGVEQR